MIMKFEDIEPGYLILHTPGNERIDTVQFTRSDTGKIYFVLGNTPVSVIHDYEIIKVYTPQDNPEYFL